MRAGMIEFIAALIVRDIVKVSGEEGRIRSEKGNRNGKGFS